MIALMLFVVGHMVRVDGQHYFQIMNATDAGSNLVNGDYKEIDFHNIPHGFKLRCNKEGKDFEPMWRRHSEYRRVWFENPQKVYVYHDVVDSKWYVEDGEGNRLYAHKDEHKKEDGSMYGDPATELPPETGYLAVEGKSPGPQFSFRPMQENRKGPMPHSPGSDEL